jgi:hypothetical protein
MQNPTTLNLFELHRRDAFIDWQDIARKENIYPHCQFLTSFISAEWDQPASSWIFKLKRTSPQSTFGAYAESSPVKEKDNRSQGDGGNDEVFERRHTILISGTGGFSWPLIPRIRGLPNPYLEDGQPESLFKVHEQDEVPVQPSTTGKVNTSSDNKSIKNDGESADEQYQGQIIHPARWPRGGIDLKGKRVAVLGNGCSATQIVSALAVDTEIQLVNFVRSGQWFLPRSVDSPLGCTCLFPPTSDPDKLNFARGEQVRCTLFVHLPTPPPLRSRYDPAIPVLPVLQTRRHLLRPQASKRLVPQAHREGEVRLPCSTSMVAPQHIELKRWVRSGIG